MRKDGLQAKGAGVPIVVDHLHAGEQHPRVSALERHRHANARIQFPLHLLVVRQFLTENFQDGVRLRSKCSERFKDECLQQGPLTLRNSTV